MCLLLCVYECKRRSKPTYTLSPVHLVLHNSAFTNLSGVILVVFLRIQLVVFVFFGIIFYCDLAFSLGSLATFIRYFLFTVRFTQEKIKQEKPDRDRLKFSLFIFWKSRYGRCLFGKTTREKDCIMYITVLFQFFVCFKHDEQAKYIQLLSTGNQRILVVPGQYRHLKNLCVIIILLLLRIIMLENKK